MTLSALRNPGPHPNPLPEGEGTGYVIIAPTYDNARTLPGVLDALRTTNLDVIVVNDGCEDDSPRILRDWAGPGRIVLTHEQNRGKAAALHTGFQHAHELGFTHAITIDTDGQHHVGDVPPLLRLSRENPHALVIGVRATEPGYPLTSRLGRAISNLLIRIESGARVADSQCGLRVYPLGATLQLKNRAGRFGYETEIITRFAWAGLPIVESHICCIYNVPGGRTTHFRIGRDSFAAVFMHIALLLRSMYLVAPKKFGTQSQHTGTLVERFVRWINPLRVWRDIRTNRAERKRFASSFATGLFVATLPPYGLKTVTCLLLAKMFRLQPIVVVGASSFNTPPFGPVLIAMSLITGHLLLRGSWPDMSRYDPKQHGVIDIIKAVGLEWIVGSVLLGAMLATLSYVILRLVFRAAPLAQPPHPHHRPAESA